MRRTTKEIIRVTSEEILLSFVDALASVIDSNPIYRKPCRKYLEQRNIDEGKFWERIKYLKRRGYVESFVEGKEKYIEITPRGIEQVKKVQFKSMRIKRNDIWDGKWRLVIFDIADKHKNSRDSFRKKLIKMEFIPIQESVYAYPFECSKELKLIIEHYDIGNDALIMVADIIQGEEDLIDFFLNKGVLKLNDIKNRK